MKKWLAILIAPSWLLFFGCSECQSYGDIKKKTQKVLKQSSPQEFPKDIAYPVVFARFLAGKILSVAESAQNISSACALSPLYGKNDICGPSPQLAKTNAAIDKKIVWKLPITPAIFYWQQNLKPLQNLIVELIDNDGLPWPTSVAITQKDNLFTVQLKPSHELPKTRELFLVGSIVGSSGEKIETWLIPLLVLEGSQSKALWAPIENPIPVKAPKKIISKKSSKKKKAKKNRK